MTKRAQLGMAIFLISAAVFFFLLILACWRFGEKPQLISRLGLPLTALLLVSPFGLWRGWRWLTVAVGVAFLVE